MSSINVYKYYYFTFSLKRFYLKTKIIKSFMTSNDLNIQLFFYILRLFERSIRSLTNSIF